MATTKGGDLTEMLLPLGESFIKLPYSCINSNLLELLHTNTLDESTLAKLDFNDLTRLAMHPHVSDVILKKYGLRGLPINPEYKLDPYQIDSIKWMKEREELNPLDTYGIRGGILSHYQGLGKTLCAITHTLTRPKGDFPTLAITSKSAINEWKGEIEKFFGDRINVLTLYQDLSDIPLEIVTREIIEKQDIVLTTYDTILKVCRDYSFADECLEYGDPHSLMKGKVKAVHCRENFVKYDQVNNPKAKGLKTIFTTPWNRVICDESQRFANPDTQLFKAMMAIYGKYKWCLSGTPIRNYDTDIWSQLRFLGYTGEIVASSWKKCGLRLFELHNLSQAVYTMTYKDAGVIIPPKSNILVYKNLNPEEQLAYNYISGITIKTYNDMLTQEVQTNFACILALLTRFRQCAIAPYLLTQASKREKLKGKDKEADDSALGIIKSMLKDNPKLAEWCQDKNGTAGIASTKMQVFIETIKCILSSEGNKVLVFSMFASALDLLAFAIKTFLPGTKFIQIDGDTSCKDRALLIDSFKNDLSVNIMLCTNKTCSESLNLVQANHVIHIEPWWTPVIKQQAESRAWRRGQTSTVTCYTIIIRDSIEDKIEKMCHEKSRLISDFLNSSHKKTINNLDRYTVGKLIGAR